MGGLALEQVNCMPSGWETDVNDYWHYRSGGSIQFDDSGTVVVTCLLTTGQSVTATTRRSGVDTTFAATTNQTIGGSRLYEWQFTCIDDDILFLTTQGTPTSFTMVVAFRPSA